MNVRTVQTNALSVVNMEEAACAAAYNSRLRDDPAMAAETWNVLRALQAEQRIEVDGRVLCTVLRPRFLAEARERELAQVSATIAALHERLGTLLLSSDRLLDRIAATEQEREIWQVDPGFPGFTHTSRLDSFMVGTVPRFVEYNAETPAGIAFSDVLTEIFRQLPAMRSWKPATAMRAYEGRQHLLDLLLWAYRERGGRGTPSIAIIDWDQVITRRDFELFAEFFRHKGYPTVITDPRALRYSNGTLTFEGNKIDIIYRRVLLHELLDKADEAQDVLRAYREGAICMVNAPRSKLLHKKSVLALISEGCAELAMSEEERETVERCIPWTRLVEPGTTTYGGREVDLPRFMMEARHRLVLKPADDYGGKGVTLGWEATPEEWERAIEGAMTTSSVVQERVPMPQGEFPLWEDGLHVEPLLVDTDPLLFRGEMAGVLTRMSSNSLLNVSAGTGSVAPTFVVPEGE